MIEVFL